MQRNQQQPEPGYLDQTLGDMVEKGIEAAQRTGEFAMEQAPELLKEFYMWHTSIAIFWLCVFVLLAIILNIFCWRMSKDSSEAGTWQFFMWLLPMFCMIGVAVNAYTLVYISVAPRLYLIDYYLT